MDQLLQVQVITPKGRHRERNKLTGKGAFKQKEAYIQCGNGYNISLENYSGGEAVRAEPGGRAEEML